MLDSQIDPTARHEKAYPYLTKISPKNHSVEILLIATHFFEE